MTRRKRTKFVREGSCVAEIEADLLEEPEGWSPYLSLEDACRLDDVREALRRGDVETAARYSRVFSLAPVVVQGVIGGINCRCPSNGRTRNDALHAFPFHVANACSDLCIEFLSTGGTATRCRDAGVPAVEVSSHTGFPEMMDGRLETLHPRIHGDLLA